MRPERKSQVSPWTVWTIGLNVLAMAAILMFLYYTRDILLLLVVSLILAGAINPAIVWLGTKGLKRTLSVILIFALFLGVLVLLGFSFVPMFEEQVGGLINSAPQLLERLREHSWLRWADERFNLRDLAQGDLQKYGKNIGSFFFGFFLKFFRGAFALISIFVLTIFMLIFGGDILEKGLERLGPERRFRYSLLMRSLQTTVGGYVIGSLLIASVGGAVVTLTLLILGVPYFLPLGLITIVFGLIPFIGPILAGVVTTVMALATAGVTSGIIMGIVFVVYQQAENHILQPLVQRRTIQMNPLLIVITMLLGTSLAGLVGAILALPVAGAIQVLIRGLVLPDLEKPV
jgi:predicted PurR-regulated permease PerM